MKASKELSKITASVTAYQYDDMIFSVKQAKITDRQISEQNFTKGEYHQLSVRLSEIIRLLDKRLKKELK